METQLEDRFRCDCDDAEQNGHNNAHYKNKYIFPFGFILDDDIVRNIEEVVQCDKKENIYKSLEMIDENK